MKIEIKNIKKDGLPDMSKLKGRVAFIYDGCIVTGWPLKGCKEDLGQFTEDMWEGNSDVGHNSIFKGIKYYVIFPIPLFEIEQGKHTFFLWMEELKKEAYMRNPRDYKEGDKWVETYFKERYFDRNFSPSDAWLDYSTMVR